MNSTVNKKDAPVLEDLFGNARNKCIARHIILSELEKKLDGEGISCNDNKHVHVVIVGTDELCMALIRQVALLAHYPNFDDEKGNNRTKITLLDTKANSDTELLTTVQKVKDATGNLLQECIAQYIIYENGIPKESSFGTDQSYIDLEFNIVGWNSGTPKDFFRELVNEKNSLISVIAIQGILNAEDIAYIKDKVLQLYEIDITKFNDGKCCQGIDVRRAKLVNAVYSKGERLKEVNPKDIYCVKEYKNILCHFVKYSTNKNVTILWKGIEKKYKHNPFYANEMKLSNVFCADCFDSKIRSVTVGGKTDKSHSELIAENIEFLAKSEHARWNVEKLILGFRPLSEEEDFEERYMSSDEKEKRHKKLKIEDKMHIDIRSCGSLMSLNPENFKYDIFLVLAIDEIEGLIKEEGRIKRMYKQICKLIKRQ